jgi:type II secretory pathway pseudopilin PulG
MRPVPVNSQLSPKAGRAAFTILELLVVICIIAILIGFVLPSFLRTRELANQRKAVVTAKGLELAFNEYYNQNHAWPSNADSDANPVKGSLLNALVGGAGTAFFEIGTNTVDTFKDPWGAEYYQAAFDLDFDNEVEFPLEPGKMIKKSVIVWSVHSYTNFGQGTRITNKSWE